MDIELQLILENLEREENEYSKYLEYLKQRQLVVYDTYPMEMFNYFMLSLNTFLAISVFNILALNNTIKLQHNKKKK